MKITRQVTLHFREGTSDKVYEVDLCEVGPDRFVVNFRFGRRGATLKDGSKTPLPVSRVDAEKAYDALVREKTAKGYRPVSAAELNAPAPAAPPVRVEDVADPRHRRIVALLQGAGGGWTRDPDRIAWRAGELRVREAARALEPMLGNGTERRAWNAARALLRCGDPASVAALSKVAGAPHVQSMATHAILTLASDRAARIEALHAQLPSEITVAACEARPDLLDRLYQADHPALPGMLASVPFKGKAFLGVRRVYQAAEARGDGEVWGLLARRIDVERPAVPAVSRGRQRKATYTQGWSRGTRTWFRRRAWRAILRLGLAGMGAEYCRMAAGLLLAYTDDDAHGARRTEAYDWAARRNVARHFDVLSSYWALGQVLYRESPRYTADAKKLRWLCEAPYVPGQPPPPAREEAFPLLWDDHPDVLADLLGRSRFAPVHLFAARALAANRPAWAGIPVASLVAWFASPYSATAEFAAEVALTRHDPRSPDLALVLALLSCPHVNAQGAAAGWVRANPAPFLRDLDFLVALVLNPEPRSRRLALEVLGAATLPAELGRGLVARIAAFALGCDDSATERLRDAAAVLITAFSGELKDFPLDRVTALVTHPAAGAAELGAKILLGHAIRPRDLPDDLLAALISSPHAVARGIGIRLYGELPDAVLAERFRVLMALVTHALPDVRLAVRPIVARLATGNAGFARVLLAALIPVMAAGGPVGFHDDLVNLLRTDLASIQPRIEPAQVFRLLRAAESVVQELGGDLLRTNVDPGTLAPHELAVLASSDILGVRRTAWALLEARTDDVRRSPGAVLPLLDAAWADSRAFATRFVEEKLGPEHLTPEVAVAICDSVRPDVQAFGRRVVTRLFEAEDGPTYLMQLAQHPGIGMQLFASAWLEQHAAGNADRLARLVPFCVGVLARPNAGKIAKARVFAFLEREAVRDEPSARIVAGILDAVVLSAAKTHRARAIGVLAAIHRGFPEVAVPLRVVEPELRRAV